MFNILGKLFGLLKKEYNSNTESIQQLATLNAINRRKNTRVNYPKIGAVGGLPRVFFENKEIRVKDISTGGLCLFDDKMLIGEVVGENININLVWADHSTSVRSTVVGCNMERRHIQFIELKPETFTKLSLLLKPGIIGTKFHKVIAADNVTADEVWVGPTGENLVINPQAKVQDEVARMTYAKKEILIMRDGLAVFNQSHGTFKKGQRVPSTFLSDIVVALANIQKPSDKVMDLIRFIQKRLSGSAGNG